MRKYVWLFIFCSSLLCLCKAQTNNTIITNASVDLIIKNSPRQTLYIRKTDQGMNRMVIDSVEIGNGYALDSLHYDLYIGAKEENLDLGFSKKRSGMFMPLLAPGDHLRITMDLANPGNIIFKGSELTKELNDFQKKSQTIGENRFNYLKLSKLAGPIV